MKSVSVIIPHYNSRDDLETLLSTIPMTEEVEVIVVDDNSNTDNSPDYLADRIAAWGGASALFCNDDKKHSAGRCRNIGMDHATGKWLMFADADDYFLPGMWDAVSAKLDSMEDIVFFPPKSIKKGTDIPAERHIGLEKMAMDYYQNHDFNSEMLLRYCWASPWSRMIRRSLVVYHNIRFDEVLAGNDRMFSVRTGHAARSIKAVNDSIYMITKSENSLEFKHSADNYVSRGGARARYKKFLYKNLTKEQLQIVDPYKTIKGSGSIFIATALKKGYGARAAFSIAKEYIKAGTLPTGFCASLKRQIKRIIDNKPKK